MFPEFQAIKDTSVAFICVGKVGRFKRSDTEIISICCGSADDMVLNPTLDVFSVIPFGSWNLWGNNHILIYLNILNHCLYARRALQGARDVTEMIYPTNISAFVEEKNQKYWWTFQVYYLTLKWRYLIKMTYFYIQKYYAYYSTVA